MQDLTNLPVILLRIEIFYLKNINNLFFNQEKSVEQLEYELEVFGHVIVCEGAARVNYYA